MDEPARVVLDANALDPLIDQPGAYDFLELAIAEMRIEVLYTHVTLDELAEVPDLERRRGLLLAMVALGRLVPTGACVADFSSAGHARAHDDPEAVEAFRLGNLKHTHDALIAATAEFENAALVTADRRLTARAQARGVRVRTMTALLKALGHGTASESPVER